MGETSVFKFPYPTTADSPAGPAQIEAAVKKIEEKLLAIELLITGTPSAGQLVVVSGTSHPEYKTITGDVTFNSSGVATLGAEKVTTAKIKLLAVEAAQLASNAVTAAKLASESVETAKIKLLAVTTATLAAEAVTTGKIAGSAITAALMAAESVETAAIKNGAVTAAKLAAESVEEAKIKEGAVGTAKLANAAASSQKLKPTAGVVAASEALAVTTSYQDVPGAKLEITPAVASTLLIVATFDFQNPATNGPTLLGTLKLDSETEEAAVARWKTPSVEGTTGGVYSQVYALSLSVAAHTIKMRAKREGGISNGETKAVTTRMLYTLFAS